MEIDSSDFITQSSADMDEWSRETAWFFLTRFQLGSRLLLRKSLKPEYLGDIRLRETLRKEYAIGSIIGMDTDYVVSYYQMVDTPEECYLTMDFVEGSTLAEIDILEPSYFSQESNVIRMLLQLLEGLRIIHRNQVVHLDLKPSNIMLSRVSHDVRIIDLGFCYSDAYQTSMGMTDAFAAPEQKDGSGEVDARTDIYAIGKLLQWLSTSNEKKHKWSRSSFIKKFISRCLCDKKEDRWQTVDEMIDYINAYGKGRRWYQILFFTLASIVSLIALYYVYEIPVASYDKHVLYGNFSILNGTCEAVGKIKDDEKDPNWQGNIYVYSEVIHWGLKYKVEAIAENAFFQDTTFSTVWFPPTIKRIGAGAFRECPSLMSINIPEGVEEIGPCAFWMDENLDHVQIPSTIKTIPESCFHKCKFSSVVVPEGVSAIELDAFAGCPNLKEIHLPQSLKRLGRGAFWQCESLDSISIPSGLTSIGEYIFMGCNKLKQIENHATDPQPAMSLFDHPTPDIHLLVPPASLAKYQQAPEWKELIIEPLSAQ